MNAKPHLNGNTPESFVDAGLQLHTIAIGAKEGTRMALAEITHGRNYQHHYPKGHRLEPINSARSEDLARIAKIIDALDDLEAIGRELFDIGSTE
jgi:hypothetical protein